MNAPDYKNSKYCEGELSDLNSQTTQLNALSGLLVALNVGYVGHFSCPNEKGTKSFEDCVALWEANEPRICRGYLDVEEQPSDVPTDDIFKGDSNSISFDKFGFAIDTALKNLDISSLGYGQLRAVNFAIPLFDKELSSVLSSESLNKWNELKQAVKDTPQLTEETFAKELEKMRPILDYFRPNDWTVEGSNEMHSEYCVYFPDSFEMAGYDFAFSAMEVTEYLWNDIYEDWMYHSPILSLNLQSEFVPKNLHEVQNIFKNFDCQIDTDVCQAVIDSVQEPECEIAVDINKDNYKEFCYPEKEFDKKEPELGGLPF